jgi:hypothetical protein
MISMTNQIEKVYAGLAGRPLEVDSFDLGEGVSICATYAHIMAPLMVAFAPAPPGKHHPGPWKTVSGGFGFDILSEISIPTSSALRYNADPYATLWCIVALIRLRNGAGITMPALTTLPFANVKGSGDDISIWSLEIEPKILQVQSDHPAKITELDLAWVRKFWTSTCGLVSRHVEFSLTLQAFDQCVFLRHAPLALLSVWAGLESLFSSGRDEIIYRISTGIAAFLEPPGLNRLSFQKEIAKLYDSRSAAAHGRFEEEHEPLKKTYALVRRVLIKIIEDDHIPTRAELDAKLFGADVT